jgi:hypothetical protein
VDVRLGTFRPWSVSKMVPAMTLARAEGPRMAVRSGCGGAVRPRLAVRNAAFRPRRAQLGQTSSRLRGVALARHVRSVPPGMCGRAGECSEGEGEHPDACEKRPEAASDHCGRRWLRTSYCDGGCTCIHGLATSYLPEPQSPLCACNRRPIARAAVCRGTLRNCSNSWSMNWRSVVGVCVYYCGFVVSPATEPLGTHYTGNLFYSEIND